MDISLRGQIQTKWGLASQSSATMAQPMSPSRCSRFLMKRVIGFIAKRLRLTRNAQQPPFSCESLAASHDMNAFSFSP
jgi:hypothetical protein